MANEKILKVRLQEKIDTLDNWLALDTDANPFIPLKGEKINVKTENQILTKTGDGHLRFKNLPYDVYAWAKTVNKPTYTASEVGADAAGAANAVQTNLNNHSSNATVHTTQAEKDAWNKKVEKPLILNGTEIGENIFTEVAAAYNAGRQIIYIPNEDPTITLYLHSITSSQYEFIGFKEVEYYPDVLELKYNYINKNGWQYNKCQTKAIPWELNFDRGETEFIDLFPFTEYSYTNVARLAISGNRPELMEIHGFITFANVTPEITVTGFTGASGDDITSAKASEVWEFSVDCDRYLGNGCSYIIWKNWGVPTVGEPT